MQCKYEYETKKDLKDILRHEKDGLRTSYKITRTEKVYTSIKIFRFRPNGDE